MASWAPRHLPAAGPGPDGTATLSSPCPRCGAEFGFEFVPKLPEGVILEQFGCFPGLLQLPARAFVSSHIPLQSRAPCSMLGAPSPVPGVKPGVGWLRLRATALPQFREARLWGEGQWPAVWPHVATCVWW